MVKHRIKIRNGIKDFVDAICTRPMLKESLEICGEEWGTDDDSQNPEKYKLDMRISFNFSREASLLELYHNGSHLYEGGASMDALKMAFFKAFEDHAKDIGRMNKSEKLQFKDIESILVCVEIQMLLVIEHSSRTKQRQLLTTHLLREPMQTSYTIILEIG